MVVWVAEIRRKGGKDDELLNYDCPATARCASILPDKAAPLGIRRRSFGRMRFSRERF